MVNISTKTTFPTYQRYRVLAFVATLAMITYLDRSCFSMAAVDIAKATGCSKEEMLRWA
ncbi:MAG: hypothetical protein PHE53_13735 [Thermoguttaceae bacterium]|nr:hypothetical protein [Thermoguttaceae bacterium]